MTAAVGRRVLLLVVAVVAVASSPTPPTASMATGSAGADAGAGAGAGGAAAAAGDPAAAPVAPGTATHTTTVAARPAMPAGGTVFSAKVKNLRRRQPPASVSAPLAHDSNNDDNDDDGSMDDSMDAMLFGNVTANHTQPPLPSASPSSGGHHEPIIHPDETAAEFWPSHRHDFQNSAFSPHDYARSHPKMMWYKAFATIVQTVVGANGSVAYVASRHNLLANDIKSDRGLLWNVSLPFPSDERCPLSVAYGVVLVCGSGVAAFNATDGTMKWSIDYMIGPVVRPPVIAGHSVVFGCVNTSATTDLLAAVDINSGKVRWSTHEYALESKAYQSATIDMGVSTDGARVFITVIPNGNATAGNRLISLCAYRGILHWQSDQYDNLGVPHICSQAVFVNNMGREWLAFSVHTGSIVGRLCTASILASSTIVPPPQPHHNGNGNNGEKALLASGADVDVEFAFELESEFESSSGASGAGGGTDDGSASGSSSSSSSSSSGSSGCPDPGYTSKRPTYAALGRGCTLYSSMASMVYSLNMSRCSGNATHPPHETIQPMWSRPVLDGRLYEAPVLTGSSMLIMVGTMAAYPNKDQLLALDAVNGDTIFNTSLTHQFYHVEPTVILANQSIMLNVMMQDKDGMGGAFGALVGCSFADHDDSPAPVIQSWVVIVFAVFGVLSLGGIVHLVISRARKQRARGYGVQQVQQEEGLVDGNMASSSSTALLR